MTQFSENKFWSTFLVKIYSETWIKWLMDLQLIWISEGEQNSQCALLNPFMCCMTLTRCNFLPLLCSGNRVLLAYCITEMPLLTMFLFPINMIWHMFIYLNTHTYIYHIAYLVQYDLLNISKNEKVQRRLQCNINNGHKLQIPKHSKHRNVYPLQVISSSPPNISWDNYLCCYKIYFAQSSGALLIAFLNLQRLKDFEMNI